MTSVVVRPPQVGMPPVPSPRDKPAQWTADPSQCLMPLPSGDMATSRHIAAGYCEHAFRFFREKRQTACLFQALSQLALQDSLSHQITVHKSGFHYLENRDRRSASDWRTNRRRSRIGSRWTHELDPALGGSVSQKEWGRRQLTSVTRRSRQPAVGLARSGGEGRRQGLVTNGPPTASAIQPRR